MRGIELTPERPVDDLVELGVAAEDAGFDTVFASSHWFNRDPFAALTATARATATVRLGPGVVNPYDAHPIALASRMATLQEVADGRGVFGIGPGDRSALSTLGVERDRPLRRVLETFSAARDLWAGDRVTVDGTFEAREASLAFDVETPIPVYVGAQGPHMLRMAAKHADGVLVNAAHPHDLAWAAERIEEGRAERVRDEPLDVVAYASVSVADDSDAAAEAARPPVAFIAGDAAREGLERHGIDPDRAARIGELIGAGRLRDAFDLVTEPMIDAFCIAGRPADVGERIDAALSHVDGVVAASPLGPDPRSAVDDVAEAFDRSSLG